MEKKVTKKNERARNLAAQNNKTMKILLGIGAVLILFAAGLFFGTRRMQMMNGGGASSDLVAVDLDGNVLPAPAAAGNLPVNAASQEAGGMLVTLTLSPYPASAAGLTDFQVTLQDQNGQAISDAVISLDLTMPSMYMPPNQVTLQAGADGNYANQGRFTMRGMWRIEVIIMRGDQRISAFFDLGL